MQAARPRFELALLISIVIGYFVVAGGYALRTPAWQAPDEPAHFNYIRQLVNDGCCPVIAMGDWDNAYLETLKSERFAPALLNDLDTIQYEDHQPPLYYLLGALVYQFSGGSLIAVRMLSVVLGAGVVISAYGIGRSLLPERPGAALGAAALVAFIPQHAAILGSVNNDALALFLAGVTLWVCALYVSASRPFYFDLPQAIPFAVGLTVVMIALIGGSAWALLVPALGVSVVAEWAWLTDRRRGLMWHLLLGTLVGVALITKTTVYFLAGIALLAVLLRPIALIARMQVAKSAGIAMKIAGELGKLVPKSMTTKRRWGRRFFWGFIKSAREVYAPVMRRSLRGILIGGGIVVGIGLAFGVIWWGRNSVVYGFPDILGLMAHDVVVVGQLRTAEQIEQVGGVTPYLRGAIQTTFNSFWGQLGWMALPLPSWAYTRIGVMLLAAATGVVIQLVMTWRKTHQTPTTRQVVIGVLLGAAGVFAVLAFVYYNLSFYQVQGRYLFPALIPFALLIAYGVEGWSRMICTTVPRMTWLTPYLTPLVISTTFGAFNLWLIRFILPYLAP